jgi:hypothetical protein
MRTGAVSFGSQAGFSCAMLPHGAGHGEQQRRVPLSGIGLPGVRSGHRSAPPCPRGPGPFFWFLVVFAQDLACRRIHEVELLAGDAGH